MAVVALLAFASASCTPHRPTRSSSVHRSPSSLDPRAFGWGGEAPGIILDLGGTSGAVVADLTSKACTRLPGEVAAIGPARGGFVVGIDGGGDAGRLVRFTHGLARPMVAEATRSIPGGREVLALGQDGRSGFCTLTARLLMCDGAGALVQVALDIPPRSDGRYRLLSTSGAWYAAINLGEFGGLVRADRGGQPSWILRDPIVDAVRSRFGADCVTVLAGRGQLGEELHVVEACEGRIVRRAVAECPYAVSSALLHTPRDLVQVALTDDGSLCAGPCGGARCAVDATGELCGSKTYRLGDGNFAVWRGQIVAMEDP